MLQHQLPSAKNNEYFIDTIIRTQFREKRVIAQECELVNCLLVTVGSYRNSIPGLTYRGAKYINIMENIIFRFRIIWANTSRCPI
jgi:hypothetical protein